jgi:tRNA dimethylallyltransferase
MNETTIFCLMGPTASGKTNLSLYLAEKLHLEIISVDSAMVYRTMDIGTAKPSRQERSTVVHHLIDILDPLDSYSAAEFSKHAQEAIRLILEKGKMPLLVGGTMLYFKAFQEGLSSLPAANAGVRQRLFEEAKQYGWNSLYARLKEIDPVVAQKIHANDPQRIQRALEVWEITQKPLSHFWETEKKARSAYNFINLALVPEDRTLLHDRIAARFKLMLKNGLVEEVRELFNRGDLHLNLPSMRCVGYRQVWEYLEGSIGYEEMVNKGITATRQLAKRQLTWLRNWNAVNFVKDFKTTQAVVNYIQNLNTNY